MVMVNQIARRVNSGDTARREDVAEVNRQLETIRADFGKLLTALTDIASAKPGKKFIAPPTIRDLPEYAEQQNISEGVS